MRDNMHSPLPAPDCQADLAGEQQQSSLAGPSHNAAQLQPPYPYRNSTLAAPNLVGATIQHEMIVEYLYQQQRSRCWISDTDFVEEGAFMRDSWNSYITAPVLLSASVLAEALVDLNAEVCTYGRTWASSFSHTPHLGDPRLTYCVV